MADDIFLKIDGIDGETLDDSHKNELQIYDYGWGCDNQGSSIVGTGLTSGKVAFTDFHFKVKISSATHRLFQACTSGESIKSATLAARKAGGKAGQKDYFKVVFTDLLISHFDLEGTSDSDGVPSHNIAFNFTKAEVKYSPQAADGSLGAEKTANWDVKANKGG